MYRFCSIVRRLSVTIKRRERFILLHFIRGCYKFGDNCIRDHNSNRKAPTRTNLFLLITYEQKSRGIYGEFLFTSKTKSDSLPSLRLDVSFSTQKIFLSRAGYPVSLQEGQLLLNNSIIYDA